MSSPLADFLIFISPICILILFFLCLFRFLFRSCKCCSEERRPEDSSCSSGPHSFSQNENSGRIDWMRSLIGAGGPQIHPVSAGHPFSATDIVFIPPHILEDPFPPKYEDAIKMRSPANESATTPRRQSLTTIATNHITPVASPPPLYEVEESSRNENRQLPPPNIELPPNYSSPNLSAPLRRHRNSLTIDRPPPMFSASRRYRRSLGDAYFDIAPDNDTQELGLRPSIAHQLATTSTQTSRPSSSDARPSSPNSMQNSDENIHKQGTPKTVAIDMPNNEVSLPGAINDSIEQTTFDSPVFGARRNSNRRLSCLTVSDLNVQTI